MEQAGWELADWQKDERWRVGGKNMRLLDEFLASGKECMFKDMGTDAKAASKRNSIMDTIKRNKRFAGKVKVSKRGTRVYLIRTEQSTTDDP